MKSSFNAVNGQYGYKVSPEDVLQQGAAKVATAKEYADWLEGYLGNGGKITHLYDYDIKQADFYVIAKDIDLPPFCGASSLNIIVPEGVKVNEAGGCSHNKLYMMDGYKHEASMAEIVPVYTDVLAEMRNRPFFQGAIGKLEQAFILKEKQSQAFFDNDEARYKTLRSQGEALLQEFSDALKAQPAAPELAAPEAVSIPAPALEKEIPLAPSQEVLDAVAFLGEVGPVRPRPSARPRI